MLDKFETTNKIIRIFYGVFSLCFAFVLFNVIFKNEYLTAAPIVIVTALCLAFLVCIHYLLGKFSDMTEKQYKIILIAFTAAMFIAELVFGLILRYHPLWDVGAVQEGASQWVETGSFAGYYEYYSYFPNNLGAMTFLYIFSKAASVIGINDHYAVYTVINSAMLSVMMMLVSLICRKLSDIRHGLFALILFALSVQFYFMGGAVYTDSLSMLFPVLAFWLYLRSKNAHGKKKLAIYIFIGISVAVGAMIKITVLIMGVALLIGMCFDKKPKDAAAVLLCIAGAFALMTLSLNSCLYSKHLDRNTVQQMRRPHAHWIMMGLAGDGRYNGNDYVFTDSWHGIDEKREKINEEIVNRIKKLGVPGLYKLAGRKSAIDFGDGTYGIADFLGIRPERNTKLHEWILYEGEHHKDYNTYATSMHIAIMLLMLINAILMFIKNNDMQNRLLIPYTALFGIWLFLLSWETHRRYFSNFAPMIFICAAVGMYSISAAISSVKDKRKMN